MSLRPSVPRTYDGYGRPLTVTDAVGNVTSMRYNALGQVVEVIAPARPVAPLAANGENAVDPFRNQLSETLVTSMTLDPFGRAVRLVRATAQGDDARVTLQSYDAAGNLVTTTDAEGNVKRRSCDATGRVIRETQAIQADLGPLGINSQGLERRYTYDDLGQLTDTLDVYVDGTDLLQSGKSVVYNAFGEVVEEQRKWGPASDSPATLNMARVARFHYDNAGHVFEKLASDRLTLYFYNLLDQVTREEKRGNSGDTDGTGHRVTEFQYDVLGRATMIRRPVFDADVTPGTGTTLRRITPYSSRTLDRWGNVTNTEEGGYEIVNGLPSFAPNRMFRSYMYDDSGRVIRESLGTHGFTSSSGLSTNALILKVMSRDLLGNVVKEVDEARDPQSDALNNSRTRRKQYDNIGRLTAEIDATNRKLEYAYNIHGERLGVRNARGTVFFDRYDRNGNVQFHGVLRTSSPSGAGEYNSHAGTGTLVRTHLNALSLRPGQPPHCQQDLYRRCEHPVLVHVARRPQSRRQAKRRDGRRHPVPLRPVRQQGGRDRRCRRPHGMDVRHRRLHRRTHRDLPAAERRPAMKFGRFIYNDFGEVRVHTVGNTMTEYDRHMNGLVAQVTITPDVTSPNAREIANLSI